MIENININGKSYSSFKEWAEEMKNDPNNETLIWEYMNCETMIGQRAVNGTGKCTYRGKTYEGKIEYDADGHVYVGGEFVK